MNLGSGTGTPAYAVSGMVEKIVRNEDRVSRLLREQCSDCPPAGGFYADISLARSQLGWTPKWSLEKGLEEIYKSLARA
jgi:nucleoside-diphosphate-sugar epimerase